MLLEGWGWGSREATGPGGKWCGADVQSNKMFEICQGLTSPPVVTRLPGFGPTCNFDKKFLEATQQIPQERTLFCRQPGPVKSIRCPARSPKLSLAVVNSVDPPQSRCLEHSLATWDGIFDLSGCTSLLPKCSKPADYG
jgi:hypothetical protein